MATGAMLPQLQHKPLQRRLGRQHDILKPIEPRPGFLREPDQ